jgi:N-acetyl-gamma-glutamyl-phosphate reductase
MIRVGIIGGAGYTAGELLRILIGHPQVAVTFIHSQSQSGRPVHEIHSGLIGECELSFTDEMPLDNIDVLFLCTAHGDSLQFMETTAVPDKLRIIDLSTDFRHKRPGNDFVYGLPEYQSARIRTASHIANPGCFATCIELALLPLAAPGLLRDDVHVHAITGSTGSGVKPSATNHFSWRNNNLSIYKPFVHQHLKEINETIMECQPDFGHSIHFIPMRGNFTRGIFASAYTLFDGTLEEAYDLYESYYRKAAFTFVTQQDLDLKQVVNTNKCLIQLLKHDNQLLIVSMIDNLLKGASGQAVQNMNLMFGLPEKTGLNLKAVAF